MKHIFISHISEEGATAERLKAALNRDFLNLVKVFVSSDTESIAAGEEWLDSVEKALRDCEIFVTLCSPESLRRAWINFETGAAWILKIPVIPICHSGLLVEDLPMPLSLKQGLALSDGNGLCRLYTRIAGALGSGVPDKDWPKLAKELSSPDGPGTTTHQTTEELDADRDIRQRLTQSLNHPKHKWRTLARIAVEAAVSEEKAADILRGDSAIRFSRNPKKETIIGLRSRVGG
jgi:TIR domain